MHNVVSTPLPPPLDIRLTVLPDHPCPYLPGRVATNRAFVASRISAELYHDLMDAGFRRSGSLVYQPVCRDCRQCIPIRVPVERFEPNKSQRRCMRRNAGLIVDVREPVPTDEKFDLYQRYVAEWHNREGPEEIGDRAGFESFLYESPVSTLEFTYRSVEGRLLAVGICDQSRLSLSSVYFYFDPAQSHLGLGTYGALYEIAWAKQMGIAYYYLGYWVGDCGTMRYKSNFRPCQILSAEGNWRDITCK